MGTILTNTMVISFRLLPIFVVAPVSSFRRVPMTVRVILTVVIAFVMASTLTDLNLVETERSLLFRVVVLEFLIGASLAFSFHAANAAVHMMGNQIDLQMGFAAASIFDPSTETTTTPTGEILTLGLLVSLIILNVHHDILLGFAKLLSVLPPGSMFSWSEEWLKILGAHFTLGFIIASPVIISLWFTDLTLAFISRSLPQAQIYFVGLPVKVGIGILLLAWFMNNAIEPFQTLLMESLFSWDGMFRRIDG